MRRLRGWSWLWMGVAVLGLPQAGVAQGEIWLTDPEGSARFEKQAETLRFEGRAAGGAVIAIDGTRTYQEVEGFGYTMTGGSAQNLMKMSAAARAEILRELFEVEGNAIGVSYLRVSIGASDLDETVFSYDDQPKGETDPELDHFSLEPDRRWLIPVLKEVLAIAPGIRILGSPWSPPTWMKTNGNSVGGSLKAEFSPAYAQYFVKYIEAMQAEGIAIDAVTVQNEPLHPGNNPSLLMPAAEQATFVKRHLGPAFQAAGLKTKILIYDHNCDKPEYPLSILGDPEARQYVAGSAFHLYGGRIEALSKVHDAYPEKGVYFTEQWIGAPGNLKGDLGWHTRELIVGATRNWSRTVLEWNLAADPQQQPHTPGGCDRCLGAITIDGDRVTRNPAYYVIAHASKFVRPGSLRVESTVVEGLPNVAFRAPDGRRVLIVLNDGREPRGFGIREGGKTAKVSLGPGAVGTYVWR